MQGEGLYRRGEGLFSFRRRGFSDVSGFTITSQGQHFQQCLHRGRSPDATVGSSALPHHANPLPTNHDKWDHTRPFVHSCLLAVGKGCPTHEAFSSHSVAAMALSHMPGSWHSLFLLAHLLRPMGTYSQLSLPMPLPAWLLYQLFVCVPLSFPLQREAGPDPWICTVPREPQGRSECGVGSKLHRHPHKRMN